MSKKINLTKDDNRNSGISLPRSLMTRIDSVKHPDIPRSRFVFRILETVLQKQNEVSKDELEVCKSVVVQDSSDKPLGHKQNNRPPYLRTGKTLYSHRFKRGKVDTVLTRQGEVSLDSGNSIPCGGFPAFEVTNYTKLNKRNIEYFWHKVDNAVKRHNVLKCMGIADNCNTYPSAGVNSQT